MRKPLWEIKQAAEGVLQLYIYGDVEGEEFDWENWRYVQSDNSAEHFREELAKHPDVSRIEIYINSYGGSVFEGTAIYNQLKRHPARKVVHVDGFACSIASVIAMAGDEGGAAPPATSDSGRRGDHAAQHPDDDPQHVDVCLWQCRGAAEGGG